MEPHEVSGVAHTCQKSSIGAYEGSISCSGDNTYGQVSGAPSGSNWKAIKAGAYHSCALRSTGQIYCWGRDNHGQGSTAPTENIYGGISSGNNHNCATTHKNIITCWGNDE